MIVWLQSLRDTRCSFTSSHVQIDEDEPTPPPFVDVSELYYDVESLAAVTGVHY